MITLIILLVVRAIIRWRYGEEATFYIGNFFAMMILDILATQVLLLITILKGNI